MAVQPAAEGASLLRIKAAMGAAGKRRRKI